MASAGAKRSSVLIAERLLPLFACTGRASLRRQLPLATMAMLGVFSTMLLAFFVVTSRSLVEASRSECAAQSTVDKQGHLMVAQS